MATFLQQSHRLRVGDDTYTMISDSQDYVSTTETLLGDRKNQRFAVTAVATEVSGEVGRSFRRPSAFRAQT